MFLKHKFGGQFLRSPIVFKKLQMRDFVLCILILFGFAFQQGSNNGIPIYCVNQSAPIDTSYSGLKSEIIATRDRIKNITISNDSLSRLFTNLLTEKIIPHWLGTPWSFEGHTSIPRQGEIACGYFVSTTLQDVGFNLNRYKFAQQLPIHEAKTLAVGMQLLEINSSSTSERINTLKETLKEGIYFIGFDQNHVGYIQKKKDELLVIHSNYINAQGVVIEKIEESKVFSYYTRIYIAEISRNIPLMKKWVNNEVIQIKTE